MNDSSLVLCPSCVDPTLPPQYPTWRVSMAWCVLFVHVTMTVVAFSSVQIQRKRMDMRGRDLHLMNFLAFGMFCCAFGPIRDILGEENTPCLFVMVLAALLNIFYLLTLVVRIVRVIAMHYLQTKLAATLADKENSPLLRPPSEETGGIQLTGRSVVSTDAFTAPRTPVAGEAMVANDSAQSPKPSVTPLQLPIIHKGSPAASTSTSCCSAIPYAACLERLQLHRTRGQVILLALLSLPNVLLCIHTAATNDKFQWNGFGCPGNDAERTFYICLFVSYLSFHLFGLWYVYRRPDAFQIREEIVLVTVLSFIQCAVILFANSKAGMTTVLGGTHFAVYYGIWTTWIYVGVLYVRPLCRSTAGRAWRVLPELHVNVSQVVPMDDMRSAEEPPMSPRSVKSGSFAASPRLHNTLSLPFAERESMVFSSRVGQAAAGTGMSGVERRMGRVKGHVLGTLMFFYQHPGWDDKCVSLHYIRRDVETVLRKQNHVYSGLELLQISALMASIPAGRNRLSSLLSSEWCLELLLFLVDLDTYRRNKARLTLLWSVENPFGAPEMHDVTAPDASQAFLLPTLQSSADKPAESPPTLPGSTKLPARKGGRMEAFLKSSCDSASFLVHQYLLPRSPTPLNVAPKTARDAAGLADECSKLRKEMRYPNEELLTKLERVSAAFTLLEKEVLNLIACGPMLRFVATPDFQEWRQQALAWVLQGT